MDRDERPESNDVPVSAYIHNDSIDLSDGVKKENNDEALAAKYIRAEAEEHELADSVRAAAGEHVPSGLLAVTDERVSVGSLVVADEHASVGSLAVTEEHVSVGSLAVVDEHLPSLPLEADEHLPSGPVVADEHLPSGPVVADEHLPSGPDEQKSMIPLIVAEERVSLQPRKVEDVTENKEEKHKKKKKKVTHLIDLYVMQCRAANDSTSTYIMYYVVT